MSKYDGSKGPPDIEGMVSLKVDNLTYRTTMDDLDRYFRKFGGLGDIYIPRDRDTHESRGFAFIRFFKEADAEDAMDTMDGKVIDGREIRVAMARYGRPSNQYDPRRQGGGSSRYRDRGSSGGYGYRDRDRRDGYRDRRRSPPRRRRSYSKSRSRSKSRGRRSRSKSRSPRYHRKSSSHSPRGRSPRRSLSPRRSHSPRRSRSRSRSHHN